MLYIISAYFQVRQDLGIAAADHVWQDKRTAIAQSVDPALRSRWLSYIHSAYPEDTTDGAGPPVGEDMLVLSD